jgi:hypothetical protein
MMNNQQIKSLVKKLIAPVVSTGLALTILVTTKSAWQYFGLDVAVTTFLMTSCFALLFAASMLTGNISFKMIFYSFVLISLALGINRADLWLRPANYAPQVYREWMMKKIARESKEIIAQYSGYSKIEISTESGVKLFVVHIRGTVPTLSIAQEFHSEFIDRFPELEPRHILWDVTLKSTNERLIGRNNVFERIRNDRVTNNAEAWIN